MYDFDFPDILLLVEAVGRLRDQIQAANPESEKLPRIDFRATEGAIGRPISRREALRIARQILERAERERMEFAEWEATRGIPLEEGQQA